MTATNGVNGCGPTPIDSTCTVTCAEGFFGVSADYICQTDGQSATFVLQSDEKEQCVKVSGIVLYDIPNHCDRKGLQHCIISLSSGIKHFNMTHLFFFAESSCVFSSIEPSTLVPTTKAKVKFTGPIPDNTQVGFATNNKV